MWLFLTASLPEVGGAWERPELSGAESSARRKKREGGGGGGDDDDAADELSAMPIRLELKLEYNRTV